MSLVGTTRFAYLRWLITQREEPAEEYPEWFKSGWLIEQQELQSLCGPGQTNLSALHAPRQSRGEVNNSKGCGAVMRMAPVGLMCWKLNEGSGPSSPIAKQTFELRTELSELNHGHPSEFLTGGVLGLLIQALIDGVGLKEALLVAKSILVDQKHHEETLQAIEMDRRLKSGSYPL